MHTTPTIATLSKIPLFNAISHDILGHIVHDTHIRHLKKKEMLYFQGDLADRCYVIMHGAVKIYLETPGSCESVICVAGYDEILGDISIHEGARFLTSAQVVEDAELLAISATDLRKHLRAHGQLASNLLKSVSCSMQKLVRQIEHQTVMSAPQRLGCFLLKLARCQQGDCKGGVVFPYEKRVIAAQLQMTPETLSRALETLKKHGLHVNRDAFVIKDPTALSTFSCGNCSRIPIPGEQFPCCDYIALPSNDVKKDK